MKTHRDADFVAHRLAISGLETQELPEVERSGHTSISRTLN